MTAPLEARAPGPGADGEVLLRAEQVSKAFPGTLALDRVDYQVRRAAVNVLVGENGAGKSTLMKILAGVEQPTTGRLSLEGHPVAFRTVHDAAAHGIGIVYQELNLCPNLSIADNIFLTHPFTRARIHLDRKRQCARAGELLRRLEHDLDPETPVGELRLGEQQVVEIAKALSRDVRVLIMDEPTSALSAAEVEVLFRVIGELKRQGVAIIYISHRLEEVVRIGDHIAVLRDGCMQAQAPMGQVDVPWIIERMVGLRPLAERRPVPAGGREDVLRVEGATLLGEGEKRLVDGVDLRVAAGEVVALYGLMGAGRSELFEFIYGLRPEGLGRVWVGGREITRLSLAERIRAGVSLVPEDRQRDGLLQNLSVARNLSIASLYQLRRGLQVDRQRESAVVRSMIDRLRIKVASPDASITSLSGGNQQKVVIGKNLLTAPKLLLLDDPTRGIDIGAKAEVFKTMRQLADSGLAVVFASSDLNEVLTAADRIVVLSQGKVAGDLSRDDASEERLVSASTRFLATSPAAARRASEP
jgi:erythritol transport system ATP-binding protein